MKFLKNTMAIVALFAITPISAMDRPESPRQSTPCLSLKSITENDKNTIRMRITAQVTKNPNLANFIKKGDSGEFILIFKGIIRNVAMNFKNNEVTRDIVKGLLLDAIGPMLNNLNKSEKMSWEKTIENTIYNIFSTTEEYLQMSC